MYDSTTYAPNQVPNVSTQLPNVPSQVPRKYLNQDTSIINTRSVLPSQTSQSSNYIKSSYGNPINKP